MPLPKLKILFFSETCLRFCAIDSWIRFFSLAIASKKIQNCQWNLCKVVTIWHSQWNLGLELYSEIGNALWMTSNIQSLWFILYGIASRAPTLGALWICTSTELHRTNWQWGYKFVSANYVKVAWSILQPKSIFLQHKSCHNLRGFRISVYL